MAESMTMQSESRKVPFFILGAQRSGTTMLRLTLNNHPNIAVPHETAFMTLFYRRLHEYGDLSRAENAARLLDDIARNPLVARGGILSIRKQFSPVRLPLFPTLSTRS